MSVRAEWCPKQQHRDLVLCVWRLIACTGTHQHSAQPPQHFYVSSISPYLFFLYDIYLLFAVLFPCWHSLLRWQRCAECSVHCTPTRFHLTPYHSVAVTSSFGDIVKLLAFGCWYLLTIGSRVTTHPLQRDIVVNVWRRQWRMCWLCILIMPLGGFASWHVFNIRDKANECEHSVSIVHVIDVLPATVLLLLFSLSLFPQFHSPTRHSDASKEKNLHNKKRFVFTYFSRSCHKHQCGRIEPRRTQPNKNLK